MLDADVLRVRMSERMIRRNQFWAGQHEMHDKARALKVEYASGVRLRSYEPDPYAIWLLTRTRARLWTVPKLLQGLGSRARVPSSAEVDSATERRPGQEV
jgi:hypothetical protein